jgi:N-methylhydantoinase B
MIERTEKAVRTKISQWPEGTYYTEVQTDDDGCVMDIPITIRCKLTIKNGELTFDFSESDTQVKGMNNAYYHQTYSNTLCTTFLFLGTELSAFHNEGSLKPIHVITKKGTIVDCSPGALTAGAPAVTGSLTNEAVLSVISKALPDKAIAAYARLSSPILIGYDKRTDGLYVCTSFGASAGAGAVTGYDGYQCACDMGTLGVVGKSDAEDEMSRFPWDVLKYEFRTDSHGAGKWRGSPGIIWEAVNEGGDSHNIGGAMSGFSTQGLGQEGGEPTPLNKAYVISGDKKTKVIHPHIITHFKTGDHFVILSGGGAGVGRPEERDPIAVQWDVKNELVSTERAKNIYKVFIKQDTLELDQSETKKLRDGIQE